MEKNSPEMFDKQLLHYITEEPKGEDVPTVL
jgi:hypothetical protein